MQFKDLIVDASKLYSLACKEESIRSKGGDIFKELELNPSHIKLVVEKDKTVAKDLLLSKLLSIVNMAYQIELGEIKKQAGLLKLTELKATLLDFLTPKSSGLAIFSSAKKIPDNIQKAYDELTQNTEKFIREIQTHLEAKDDEDDFEKVETPISELKLQIATLQEEAKQHAKQKLELEKLQAEAKQHSQQLEKLQAEAKEFSQLKTQLTQPATGLIQMMTTMMRMEMSFELNYQHSQASNYIEQPQKEEMKAVHTKLSGFFSRLFEKCKVGDAKFEQPDLQFREMLSSQIKSGEALSGILRSGAVRSFNAKAPQSPRIEFYSTGKKMLDFLTSEKLAEFQTLVKGIPKSLFEIYISVMQTQKDMMVPVVKPATQTEAVHSTLSHSRSS